MKEPKIPEQTCKGCKNRDRMIKRLAEWVDELETRLRHKTFLGKITAIYSLENKKEQH